MHKIKFNSNVQLLLFYIILTLDVGNCKLQSIYKWRRRMC